MDDPHMIALVDGNADDDPAVGKRLRPTRIDMESRDGMRRRSHSGDRRKAEQDDMYEAAHGSELSMQVAESRLHARHYRRSESRRDLARKRHFVCRPGQQEVIEACEPSIHHPARSRAITFFGLV